MKGKIITSTGYFSKDWDSKFKLFTTAKESKAILNPKKFDPPSPIKILAGLKFKIKNPKQAPRRETQYKNNVYELFK